MTTVSPDSQLVPPLSGRPPVAPLGTEGPWPADLIPPTPAARRSGPARLWRGRPDDAPWVRPALLALLSATGLLYLWGLGASG